jgi:signal peptidase I
VITCSVTSIVIFTYQPLTIEGNSMAPLLSDHEAIFITGIAYHLGSIERGEVVVFDYPLDRTKLFNQAQL